MNENNKLITADMTEKWEGYTLEELKRRRVVALVRRELGREKIVAKADQTRHNVAANGVRGLLFGKGTVAKLKTADYMLIGWKLSKTLLKMWSRNRK